MPTAFRARLGDGDGPRVAILAEYDALPEIGHACGHNLIAGGALGAFLAIARQRDGDLPPQTRERRGQPAEHVGEAAGLCERRRLGSDHEDPARLRPRRLAPRASGFCH